MTETALGSLDLHRPPPAGRRPLYTVRLGKTWAEVPGAEKIAERWREGRVKLHMENLDHHFAPAEGGARKWPWGLALCVVWGIGVLWALWRGVA